VSTIAPDTLAGFELPAALEAAVPPEARGLSRDQVRLLVSSGGQDPTIEHVRFRALPRFLLPGDILVVNTSATVPAAVDAWRGDERIALHVSSPHPHGGWIVELRRRTERGTVPLHAAAAGERIRLPGGAEARLLRRTASSVRLWRARLRGTGDMLAFLMRYGEPIRYAYVRQPWPLGYYQTVFADEPGSAEMPSAGRPFTRALVARLERDGVRFARIVLHTGVASLEAGEPPYPERFRVTAGAAAAINEARAAGGRVFAVGTTVVRALETVLDDGGAVHAGEGWTDRVVTADRAVRSVDGMITGLHEPRASHLAMLEALVGRGHIAAAYDAALERGYLWHEFGDAHLLLTSSTTSTGL
jgi:S-adenosylmethionine:tRNA ribosyltransferase-isomerase